METTAVESSEPPEILASSENPVLEAEVPTVEQMDTSDVAPASPSASAPVQSTELPIASVEEPVTQLEDEEKRQKSLSVVEVDEENAEEIEIEESEINRFQQCVCCEKSRSEKLLSCLHPVCARCLPGIQENEERFRCPICKEAMTEGVDNVFISMTATESVKECNWCLELNDHTRACGHCEECDHWLCKECLRGHNRNPAFRAHNVEMQEEDKEEESLLHCSEHKKEPLQLFCEACSLLTCRECQLTRHNGHKHQWVGEKVHEVETGIRGASSKLEQRKDRLTAAIKATERALATLSENEETARIALQTCAEKLAMFVKLWFDELDNCMKFEILSRRERLEQTRASMESAKSQLEYTESLLGVLLRNISPAGIIHISSPLKQRITELSRSGVESRLHWLDACTQVKFEQSRDPCGAIRHIGRLLSSPYDPEGPDTQGSNTSTSRDIRELSVPQISNVTSTIMNRREPPSLSGPGELVSNGAHSSTGQVSSSSPPPILLAPHHNPNDPHMDYCCVCYDSGDLICCNLCDHVFHARCHLPALQAIPKDDWICTLCLPASHITVNMDEYKKSNGSKLTKVQRLAAYHILLRLFEDPAAAEFLYPVEPGVRDAKGTPYKRVISDPMDLTTVREKLESRQYDDLEDYLNDLQLIFDNCFKFNAGTDQLATTIREKGKSLEQKFHRLVSLLLPFTDRADSRFKAAKRRTV